jgi:hypothetical protein
MALVNITDNLPMYVAKSMEALVLTLLYQLN